MVGPTPAPAHVAPAAADDGISAKTDDPAADVRLLAQEFHKEGFVALLASQLQPPVALVERVRAAVLRKYDAHLARASDQQIDLTLLKNAERLAGFYVRQGGRVDMQISAAEFQYPRPPTADVDADPNSSDDLSIDTAPFHEMARCWQRLIDEIFHSASDGDGDGDGNTLDIAAASDDRSSARYRLEYIGCVISRPGDTDQNWHLDGVHRNLQQHERADRLNVFVPLVDLSAGVGGTEMKCASHWRAATDGASFTSYAHLTSVTHCVRAGTPIVMDYRVWHRGLANASADTLRPLLYFKYVLLAAPGVGGAKRTAAAAAAVSAAVSASAENDTKRKRKRIVLTQVTTS